jgi:hypothetical protein
MSSYDATAVIARAISTEVAHPLGSLRFLPQSEEEVALAIIEALESAGFKIVRQDGQSSA